MGNAANFFTLAPTKAEMRYINKALKYNETHKSLLIW